MKDGDFIKKECVLIKLKVKKPEQESEYESISASE
jgi:hypothetical protein